MSLATRLLIALSAVSVSAAAADAAPTVRVTITDLNVPGTIECVAYEQSVRQPRAGAGGMATGRPQFEDIVCRKRIDGSSPILLKAASTGQHLKQAVFRFFNDGSSEPFYTVTITDVTISGVKQFSPGTADRPSGDRMPPRPGPPGSITASLPAMEDVSFAYAKIDASAAPGRE